MKSTTKAVIIIIAILVALILVKVIWVKRAIRQHGSFETEKAELLRRRNYLIEKINVEPQQLIDEMPTAVGPQFQGEWALYSLSMLTQALSNLAVLYPETHEESVAYIDSLITIAISSTIRHYDAMRWHEDPLETLDGDNSHISYLSHLAWLISNYKAIGGDSKYDDLYNELCATMNRRMLASPSLNLPTYPGEYIYMPDMFVAIVALSNYAKQHNGQYQTTVDSWLHKARTEWTDPQTGLIRSFLVDTAYFDMSSDYINATDQLPILGSYSALNCSYLAMIDYDYGREQYELLKIHFLQMRPVAGIKEYADRRCWLGLSVDAGPILLNLTPSGTAFALGAVTIYGDEDVRCAFLKTAEMAGTTITHGDQTHYHLANIALVGEAITLAMRTMTPQ